MAMPSSTMMPPPNNPQPINTIIQGDSQETRRKKGLTKAKTKANFTFYLGFFLLTIGMFRINQYFGWGMYGYLFVCGIMLMLAAILEAIFEIAKYSK